MVRRVLSSADSIFLDCLEPSYQFLFKGIIQKKFEIHLHNRKIQFHMPLSLY